MPKKRTLMLRWHEATTSACDISILRFVCCRFPHQLEWKTQSNFHPLIESSQSHERKTFCASDTKIFDALLVVHERIETCGLLLLSFYRKLASHKFLP
jgi:hypothetical protein